VFNIYALQEFFLPAGDEHELTKTTGEVFAIAMNEPLSRQAVCRIRGENPSSLPL
jgi:chromosome segregation and condensation protein ScpB